MKSKYPLLKLLIYIVVGFFVGILFNLSEIIILSVSIASLIIIFIPKLNISLKYALVAISIGLFVFANINQYRLPQLTDKVSTSFDGIFEGEITEILANKPKYKRFVAKGRIKSNIFNQYYHCRVIFILFNYENDIELKPGKNFLTKANFIAGQPKILDEDFDEKSYLISKKAMFFGQTNIKSFAITSAEKNINTYFYDARNNVISDIKSVIKNEKIANIIVALVTGDKSNIDKDLQKEFSLTGTAHILAISGLHVGIFSLFLFVLIGWIENQTLRLIIFLIVLWGFIYFVGFPPSAVRAAFMASIYMYFIYYGKPPNMINILIFTVIIFVIFEPTIIYSISFQLSVLAIGGIFLLYKPIFARLQDIFHFQNKLTYFIASSFAISFAATIPTSVLSVYYFNVFSLIYPISNLLVLPLMTLASFESILFVIFNSIGLPFADVFIKSAYVLIDTSIYVNCYLADLTNIEWSYTSIQLIIIAFSSSILLVYIFISKSNKLMYFRVSASIILFSLILYQLPIEKNRLTLIPREQFVALLLESDKSNYLIISDRKKYDYLKKDRSLINRLKNIDKDTYIYKTGNVSINIVDHLKDNPNIKHKFIRLNDLDSLTKKFGIKHLYRVRKTNA